MFWHPIALLCSCTESVLPYLTALASGFTFYSQARPWRDMQYSASASDSSELTIIMLVY
jgi:hypothetical protein